MAVEAEDPEEQVRRFLREASTAKVRAIIGELVRTSPTHARIVRALLLGPQLATTPAPRKGLSFLEE